MIKVEKFVRSLLNGVENAYCLIFFACCREVKKISKLDSEQIQKDKLSAGRGETDLKNKTSNLILSFGCSPSLGVLANSDYIKDLINLIQSNFDESGSVVLPDLFAKVLSTDAIFECVSINLAKKLLLKRQDTVVGQKRLTYAIDFADKSRESVRKLTKDFFKDELGFTENEIEDVDRNNFYVDQDQIVKTKFSDEE